LGALISVTGAFAALGEEQMRGFDLAMEHLGGKIGGLPTEVYKADAKITPDVAVTEASRLVDRNNVQIITGILASNELNAIAKTLSDKGIFVVSGNAGSALFSGKECLPNLFVVSFHNDALAEAVGAYMTKQNIKTLFAVSLNYQAGRDYVAGMKRTYKGNLSTELYPEINTIDFSSEIAQIRAANPEAVYIFLPGRPGVTFVKQFAQAGLNKKMRLFGVGVQADELSFAALGDVALGMELGTMWTWALDNPQNRRFVDDFKKKHGRLPTFFASNQYDAVMLIDSAVRAVNGRVEDKDAFRAALRKADFKPVKGKFRFNNNHYPIQDHYIVGVEKDGQGGYRHKLLAKATEDHEDMFHAQCEMKW
jgi:branched-chain amino acid transport system substrate-binding protein